MSVYVDNLSVCLKSAKWPYTQACYLVADSVTELYKFATRIGLRHDWFQAQSFPHFDLTQGMRRKAVKAGAIELNRKKFVQFIRKYRMKGKEQGNGK